MSEDARKAEATGKTPTAHWRGHEFTLPASYDDWSVDLAESIEEGKAVGIVRGALGPQQWNIVRGYQLNMRELAELSNAIIAAMGFTDAGESQASSD